VRPTFFEIAVYNYIKILILFLLYIKFCSCDCALSNVSLVNVTYWHINDLDNDLACWQHVAEKLYNIKTVLCTMQKFCSVKIYVINVGNFRFFTQKWKHK